RPNRRERGSLTLPLSPYFLFVQLCFPSFHSPFSSSRLIVPYMVSLSCIPVAERTAFLPSTLRFVSLMSLGSIIFSISMPSLGVLPISLVCFSISLTASLVMHLV